MSKNVVVLGASGYIGQGACLSFLKQGYTVVAQSREQGKLESLKTALVKQGADVSKLHFVTGTFQSEAEAKAVAAEVQKLIGVPQHVLCILGFFDNLKKPASETTPEEMIHNFGDTFWPNMRAANAFIPLQKGKVRSRLVN
jgi:NAD(P)-dependent dehydrogenase (short-subunit alcohol dehydrogenase family)